MAGRRELALASLPVGCGIPLAPLAASDQTCGIKSETARQARRSQRQRLRTTSDGEPFRRRNSNRHLNENPSVHLVGFDVRLSNRTGLAGLATTTHPLR